MSLELLLFLMIWWIVGFVSDIITDYYFYRDFKTNDWMASVIVGCLGFAWVIVCIVAILNTGNRLDDK